MLLIVLNTDISQKSRRSLQPKNESTLASPSNTTAITKSPSTNSFRSPQNPSPSLQKFTDDSTARPKADEMKGVLNDSSTLSPNATSTGFPKAGTINTPVAAGCGKTPQAAAADHDFSISSSPLTQAGVVKPNHPGQHRTRRQRFNIITGHPLQLDTDPAPILKSSPSFTSSLNKINTGDVNSSKGNTGVNIEANSIVLSAEQLQKAPHLDMRRNKFQKNSLFSGLSTYRASFKPAPGFYSSYTVGGSTAAAQGVPSGPTNPWDSSSTLMNYSRHSATVPHNLTKSKGAPLNNGFVVSTGSDSSLLG